MVLGIISIIIGVIIVIVGFATGVETVNQQIVQYLRFLIGSVFIIGGFIMITIDSGINRLFKNSNEKLMTGDTYKNLKKQFDESEDENEKRLIAKKLVSLGYNEYKIFCLGL